jgi:hypothetical protein
MKLLGNAWFGPWPTNGGAAPSHIKNHPGNFFPANRSVVGFVDLANGDYRLATSSPYKGKATAEARRGERLGSDAACPPLTR